MEDQPTGRRVRQTVRFVLTPGFELAPVAGSVVGDNMTEHGTERARVDPLAMADGGGAGGRLSWPPR